ncbi:hypothetical protein [Bacillus velezensis]|nr:hypothetical protein [Bacillus velezensis]
MKFVTSLKAETSLVLHDKQAITNMQPGIGSPYTFDEVFHGKF